MKCSTYCILPFHRKNGGSGEVLQVGQAEKIDSDFIRGKSQ